MSDCPFCKRIAAGEFDFSDEHAVAFEPLNPVVPGHLLVVPRKHIPDAGSHSVIASKTMQFAAILVGPLGWAKSYNLITSAGEPATQTVKHLHIHIVPREPGDGLALPWTGQAPAHNDSTEGMDILVTGCPACEFGRAPALREAEGGQS